MIRISLDTNVLISAFVYKSKFMLSVTKLVLSSSNIKIITCSELKDEFYSTLKKPNISKKVNDDTLPLFDGFWAKSDTILLSSKIVNEFDPKDSFLLSLSIDANLDYLISGDKKHMLRLGKIGNTKVISPRQFVELLKDGQL